MCVPSFHFISVDDVSMQAFAFNLNWIGVFGFDPFSLDFGQAMEKKNTKFDKNYENVVCHCVPSYSLGSWLAKRNVQT